MIALTGIPVIETERLRLRGPQPSDFAPCRDFLTGGRSLHVGGPCTPGQAWRSFCHLTGHWLHRGYSMFIIEDRVTDEPLGMCGPWFPEGWPEPEIGWSLWSSAAEGRGIAFEAATAARRHAYDVLGWTTAISLITEENTRSQALARRMGCWPEDRFFTLDDDEEDGGRARIWRHPGPEALA